MESFDLSSETYMHIYSEICTFSPLSQKIDNIVYNIYNKWKVRQRYRCYKNHLAEDNQHAKNGQTDFLVLIIEFLC